VAELKSHLSEHLPRCGAAPLVVWNRDTPIAQIVPSRMVRSASHPQPLPRSRQAKDSAPGATQVAHDPWLSCSRRHLSDRLRRFLSVLRLVLGQRGPGEWRSVEEGVTSALTEVECLRLSTACGFVEGIPDRHWPNARIHLPAPSTLAVMEIGRT